MHSEKGVTLVALAITIIVIAIITGTAVYTGTKSLEDTRKTAFITELKVVREKLDLYEAQDVSGIGKPLNTVSVEQQNKILASPEIGVTSLDGFVYFDEQELAKIQVTGIKKEFLIHFQSKKVISVKGIKVNGEYRYTLEQLGAEGYLPHFNESELTGELDFKLSYTKSIEIRTITVSDIVMSSYDKKPTIRYREENSQNWQTANGTSFNTTEKGVYEVEVSDNTGNMKAKKIQNYLPAYEDHFTYVEGFNDSGLVVKDSQGNEFVWVPVEMPVYTEYAYFEDIADYENATIREQTIKDIINKIGEEDKKPMAIKVVFTNNSKSQYVSVLYDIEKDDTSPNKVKIIGVDYGLNLNMEPANLPTDNTTNLPEWTSTLFQEEYDEMVNRVYQNKGFYVGRYETSLVNGIIQSKPNQPPMTAASNSGNKWYGMYQKQKSLSTGRVISHMIWGCQWDQLMIWMSDVININSAGKYPYVIDGLNMGNYLQSTLYSTDGKTIIKNKDQAKRLNTGITDYTKAKQIYDLIGNVQEATMEAQQNEYRIFRGGDYQDTSVQLWGMSSGNGYNPNTAYSNDYYGTRMVIY